MPLQEQPACRRNRLRLTNHRRGFRCLSACLAPTGRSLNGVTATRLRVCHFRYVMIISS